MTKIKYITVESHRENQRLDNFLIRELKGVPKSYIYRIIRRGEVRVNKKRTSPAYKLNRGDSIRIPPVQTETKTVLQKISASLVQSMKARIIYEDERLMILNKPAGMPVHGGSHAPLGVIESLRCILDEPYLELVHRLDKDTSGCLMIAKKSSILRKLHQLLRENQIGKTYMALVHGHWPKRKQKIDLPLRKNIKLSGERMVLVEAGGKKAETLIKPLKYLSGCTLIEATLKTGRTHQIRVHCAQSGHPIAGDDKYGNKDFNKMLKQKGLNRMFLHAYSLKFTLDDTDIAVKVELDPPLKKLLQNL